MLELTFVSGNVKVADNSITTASIQYEAFLGFPDYFYVDNNRNPVQLLRQNLLIID